MAYTWSGCCVTVRTHALSWRCTPESRLRLTLPILIALNYLNLVGDMLPATPSVIRLSFDLVSYYYYSVGRSGSIVYRQPFITSFVDLLI